MTDRVVIVRPSGRVAVQQPGPRRVVIADGTAPRIVVRAPQRSTVTLTRQTRVIVRQAGIQGARGATGATGPAGAPESYHEHIQATPAATWLIDHNIGRRVTVTVYDPDGDPYLADVHHNSPNSTSVIFTTPTAGSALVL